MSRPGRPFGPAEGLALVEELANEPALRTYHLLPELTGLSDSAIHGTRKVGWSSVVLCARICGILPDWRGPPQGTR